ncbi:MAG: hypothetical protein GY856_04035 [bacterium]|nr:hypothetical protein [bacterium]
MKKSQSRIILIALTAVTLVVIAVLLQPTVEESLAPELRTAWVGVEVGGNGIAEVGPAEIDAGTPFTLHAILEGLDRGGRAVYYTEAQRVSFSGEEVAPESLRRWKRPREVKIRWFTVEGIPPYLQVAAAEELGKLGFRNLYRSEWPLVWSIPGEIVAAGNAYPEPGAATSQAFGAQRYHVQFELYALGDSMIPGERVGSWGADDVVREADRFPTVRRVLPGPLGPASKVFGLPQLELRAEAPPALRERVAELIRSGLAFSRVTVLWDQIRAAGKPLDDLEWRSIDLTGGIRWGESAAAGDLLRVGERVVVLFEDRGEPEVLDYDDLCFDYERGAAVRALSEVFSAEGEEGLVEFAALGRE